jgi:hypothetical protein
MKQSRYPSPNELYALERNARLERSRVVGQMLASGASALRRFIARTFAAPRPKSGGLRHA